MAGAGGCRAGGVRKLRPPKGLRALESNISAGRDSLTGVLPWRHNETFYNVPTNGPAAIMLARNGRIAEAQELIDWVYDNLINDQGLVMDGVRMRMHGPDVVKDIHPYCQGVMMGACLELSERLLEYEGIVNQHGFTTVSEGEKAAVAMKYVSRLRDLVHAVAKDMATPKGVIDWNTGGGDGGLFKGILARYLADVAVRLPDDSPLNHSTRDIAARLVLASAESVWNHRLEVDRTAGVRLRLDGGCPAAAELGGGGAIHRGRSDEFPHSRARFVCSIIRLDALGGRREGGRHAGFGSWWREEYRQRG